MSEIPSSRFNFTRLSRMVARNEASTIDTGSSARMTRGLSRSPRATIHGGERVAPVQDRAHGGPYQPEEQARQGGLAAAALAGDGGDRRLVLVDDQRHAVDGDRVALAEQAATKDPGDVLSFQER